MKQEICRNSQLALSAARAAIVLAIASLVNNLGGISTAQASPRTVATQVGQFAEQEEISSLAFSPDGTRLAAVEWTGAEVHIWHSQ